MIRQPPRSTLFPSTPLFRSGREEDVATPELAPLDARQRYGHALPGRRALDRPVVHLDAPHANLSPARLGREDVARADRSRPERPDRKSTRLNSSHANISYAV